MRKFLAILLAVLMTASLSVVGLAADFNEVYPYPQSVTLRENGTRKISASINTSVVGGLKDTTLTWTSSDEAVATVDSQGVVTGVAPGTATIRASTVGGTYWGECDVTVVAADAPAVLIDGKEPGSTLYISASINSSQQRGSFSFTAVDSVQKIRFDGPSLFSASQNGENIWISMKSPIDELHYVGKSISRTMYVLLADNTEHEFTVEITFNNHVALEYNADDNNGRELHHALYLREDVGTYTMDIVDKENIAKEPLDVVFLQEGEEPIVNLDQIEIKGKQVQFTLTPLRTGSAEVKVVLTYTTEIGRRQAEKVWYASVASNNPEDYPDHPGHNPGPGGNGGSAADDDDDNESPTENAANDDKTLDKLAAGESAEVKLVSGSAALSTDTMDTLGGHGGKLTVTVDKMTVVIPGGFGKVTEPGRIYYPLDFTSSLPNASDLAAAVKGDKAKTEVVKAGGNMVMPTTVTVTLKTKLEGTVHVYHYNEETRRYTLIASPVAQDGKITFATKQMGVMVLTTGTI